MFFRAAIGQMEAGRTLVGTGRKELRTVRGSQFRSFIGRRFFTLSRTRLFEEMQTTKRRRGMGRSREQQGLDLSVNKHNAAHALPLAVLLKSRAGEVTARNDDIASMILRLSPPLEPRGQPEVRAKVG